MLEVENEDSVLRAIVAGTATETGTRFFEALVEQLARAQGTTGAWVTEYLPERRRLRALAFWAKEKFIDWESGIDGTPCEAVVTEKRLVHIPDRIFELFPNHPDRQQYASAVSYLGVPLLGADDAVLGHLAVLDTKPMPIAPRALAIFQIFAQRAAAEVRRLRAESEVREREEKLRRLVESAMDAIVELDKDLGITRLNAAAEKAFSCRASAAVGRPFSELLTEPAMAKLTELRRELDARAADDRALWIAGGLEARRADGTVFRGEATLSAYDVKRARFYTLILRNVEDRLEAERRIRTLTVEAEYLKDEIRELHHAKEIVGESAVVSRLLEDIRQVAPTDASVLISGETGTGKELVARAVHGGSARRERPLIKVNCAAIPAALIESELFGHEKGAFTGALARREGRFALADGGTIFLDEIGEMPLDLQPKLLRVLQEGEFEPVGSEKTRRIDARVIAATNRDLAAMIREGKFREDLYYRLNVFPIRIAPLRERGDDIVLLAQAFVSRFATKMRKRLAPLTPEFIERLKRYEWPGNIRELENVIERAVITAREGRLDLDRAFPESTPSDPGSGASGRIQTRRDLDELERRNLVRALEATRWKIAGEGGAAELLGMKASTLASRLKALNIKRSRS